MPQQLCRHTGLEMIGDVPWGTHFCQFYEDRQDLADLLVPYFAAGLENNEFCMWVTSEPLNVGDAEEAMRAAVPGFDRCVEAGQIKIIDYRDWYTLGGVFDADRVLGGWVEELRAAQARGLDGLRLSGNTFWLEQSAWRDFTEYEAAVDAVLHQYPMLALCTYSLARCGAAEILDVMANHAFALIKRAGTWQLIESAERKKIEASLRLTEERYRSLFNGMTEGFALHEIICNEAGEPCDYRFLDINPAFERLTGLRRSEVVGRLMTDVLPKEDPEWVKAYGRVALTGEPVHFDHYASSLDRHFDVYAYRPAPGQFAVIFLDVSQLKRAEARLADANRLKDEFLANLSHELRTPLNAILGWSDLLARKQLDPVRAERAVQAIARNAQAQVQLVSDVLDVSRIVAGRMRLRVQQVDLGDVVRGAVDVVRPAADAKGISVRTGIEDEAPHVTGDADRLQQVLWNLLSNAVKFTPPGGVVDVTVRRIDSHLEASVHDTGIGIDPGFLRCVFDRFRQADGSSSRRHGGLGLGLAIARDLVELHGGTIRAESRGEGQGSTFTISLPLRAVLQDQRADDVSPERRLARPEPCDPDQRALAGISVLAVDDEEDALDLIRTVLEHHGAEVRVAGSTVGALALLAERLPHVLVADIGMPLADGYELIGRVRCHPDAAWARLPAIALTAYGREEDRRRAVMAGFQLHVAKPVLPDVLLASVRMAASLAGAGS